MNTDAEIARIESVWLAAHWQYYDAELMVFASVGYYPHIKDSVPGKPWELGLAAGTGEELGLPEKSWYATADEAKAVLSDAVLALWLTQQATP